MKLITSILTLTSLSALAGQGGMGSGGGASVVCRDDAGKILSAEVLDLYEGRKTYKLKMKEPIGSMHQEYLRFNRTMNIVSGFGMPPARTVLDNLDLHLSRFNYLPHEIKLDLTNDYGELDIKLEENCRIEQLAIYHDKKKRIDIDSEIWNSLNNINKAALMAHEIIYKSFRRTEEKTSKLTRKIVAMLFSTTPPKTQLEDMPKHDTTVCFGHNINNEIRVNSRNNSTSFSGNDMLFIYPSRVNSGHTTIRLHSFVGRAIYGRTEIEVPTLINIDMLERNEGNLNESKKPYITVMDPNANTNMVLPVISELFGNDKVIINYKFGQKFYLSLLRDDKEILDRSFIYRCHPYSQIFKD